MLVPLALSVVAAPAHTGLVVMEAETDGNGLTVNVKLCGLPTQLLTLAVGVIV